MTPLLAVKATASTLCSIAGGILIGRAVAMESFNLAGIGVLLVAFGNYFLGIYKGRGNP